MSLPSISSPWMSGHESPEEFFAGRLELCTVEGHFGHDVRRMRQLYAERMIALKEAAECRLKGALDVVQAGAGMRTVGWVRTRAGDAPLAERARALGLELSALSQFTIRHPQPPALILGFAGCSADELRRGVNILAAALGRGKSA